MSGDADHAFVEMQKWKKYSLTIAIPSSIILMGVNAYIHFVVHADHDHHDEEEKPPPTSYMQIRTKAFPWECEDCGLFEMDCIAKCKAKMAESAE